MTPLQFKADGARVTVFSDAPRWGGSPTAALGKFASPTKEAGLAVITQALDHIRAQGIKRVLGPMEGDTWHSYRFVTQTDDSPAFLLEPTNKPDAVTVFQDAGFETISGYFSARVPLAKTAQNTLPDNPELTVEQWNGQHPEALFEQVYHLSVAAFENNVFYKPIALDAFLQMYMPVVPMMKKDLIFFVRNAQGTLVGFLFGIPNYNEGPATQTVILKTYASLQKGAGQILAHAFHSTARDLGYHTAIHALIHDDNLSALRSAAEGAEIFRRYSLFGLKLDV